MTPPHPLGNTALRTPESYARYAERPLPAKGSCFICDTEAIRSWACWKLIDNDFPYDKVAAAHLMLVPKRHVGEYESLTSGELADLGTVRRSVNREGYFDSFLENTTRGRSVLSHFHYHLLRWKRGDA